MMRPALSPAAASLLRSLLARAGVDRDRILLTSFESVDWRSLTFVGERHEIELRVPGSDGTAIARRLTDELGEYEWRVPGHVVADITLNGAAVHHRDGSVTLRIEALTIAA